MDFDVTHISWESVRLFKFLMFILQSYFFASISAMSADYIQEKGSFGRFLDVMLNIVLPSHAMPSSCS